jgi:hypothetical protein
MWADPKDRMRSRTSRFSLQLLSLLVVLSLLFPAIGQAGGRSQEHQALGSLSSVGEVYVNNSPAPADSTIFTGDTVRTGQAGTATFTSSAQGTFQISPQSQVAFNGGRPIRGGVAVGDGGDEFEKRAAGAEPASRELHGGGRDGRRAIDVEDREGGRRVVHGDLPGRQRDFGADRGQQRSVDASGANGEHFRAGAIVGCERNGTGAAAEYDAGDRAAEEKLYDVDRDWSGWRGRGGSCVGAGRPQIESFS